MCTLYGAFPGQEVVTGRNYVDIGYGLNVSDIWRRNFLVLLGFLILFQITQLVLIEYFPHFDGGSSITIYAPEDADTKKRNAILRERKERRAGKSVSEKAEIEKEEQGGYVRSSPWSSSPVNMVDIQSHDQVLRQAIHLGADQLPRPCRWRHSQAAARRVWLRQTRHYDCPHGCFWRWQDDLS